ncbi:hypothetical protein OD917_20000 [Flavobacterium sp. SH_e]|uniref:hypothetical protein n=1 Tax=Flavobacterium TaxID=237 RepID=UPI0021E3ECA8|nr:hypothetical protein [Flavobacterium sp. SH_e]MCV2487227.1 hypothetical protein [Flavobacterium sp. SH_e]
MIKTIPTTTFLLTYLFICGSLYLIGYWSTFDVDIFSLISVYDIPKNFVYPLMLSQAVYIVNMITGQYLIQNIFLEKKEDTDNFIEIKKSWSEKKQRIISAFSSISFWVALTIVVLPFVFENAHKNTFYWFIISTMLSYFLLFKFVNNSYVKIKIQNNLLRFYIGHFLTFFPIACFSSGKILSLDIYHNKKVSFFDVIDNRNNSQINDIKCLKFLGFVSDKYIYSTIDNQQVFILSKEACSGIVVSKN